VLGPITRTLVIACTILAAGCSADVTRFSFGGGGTTSSIPVPPEPVRHGYGPSATPRGLGVTEAPLPPSDLHDPPRMSSQPYDAPPPAKLTERQGQSYEPPENYRVVGRKYNTPAAARPPVAEPPARFAAAAPPPSLHRSHAGVTGESVEVQPGETLYSIGRRYGVSAAAIKDANGLTSDTVRPGQRLTLPAGASERQPFASAPPPAAERDRPAVASYTPAPPSANAAKQGPPRLVAAPVTEPPPGWEGRYTMRNGDSLYGIALRYNVTLEDLQRANGITDPTKVWVGTILNVPGERQSGPSRASEQGSIAPRAVQTQTVSPRVINAAPEQSRAPERKTLSRTDVASHAERTGAASEASKFRWPVSGQVIAGFGRRPDGKHNDGVNVAVPLGTPIHAAESGKVVYAGDELKGYGNLVLIRHSDGWVSAYAHADQVMVSAGDEVRRGQVIAKAGKTGAVDQPQVHFELRQGSKPVDPVPHLGG
jgi:murein DD-endopeptidase MepM/ murein hydrolase activator NlpD